MIRSLASLVALAVTIALAGCASQSTTQQPHEQFNTRSLSHSSVQAIDQLIHDYGVENNLKGFSVSIANSQQLLFSSAKGWASKNDKLAMTADTPTMVGSVSKLFTVTAIMQLADQGLLDLNAPISDYLPEFEQVQKLDPSFSTPLVRQMLYHHSGLQSDLLAGFDYAQNPPENWYRLFTELPDAFAQDIFQVTEPDTIMSYSNLSFSLLGIIVERVSGQRFDEYIGTEVFQPLAMDSASFTSVNTTMPVAQGHAGSKQVPYVYIRDLAAGSMVSSTNDLVKFGQMILNGGEVDGLELLRPESVKAMLTQQNTQSPLDGDFAIGYGFWLESTHQLPASVKVAFHGGDLPPYHGFFLLLPEHDLVVAVLANSKTSSLSLGVLAEQLAEATLIAQDRLPGDAPSQISVNNPTKPDESIYAMPFGYVSLTEKSPQSYKVETSFVNFRAQQQGDDSWGLQYRLFGLLPVPISALEDASVRFGKVDGQTVAWLYVSNISLGVMTPVSAVEVAEHWLTRAGTYKADDETVMFPTIKVSWDKNKQMFFAGPKLMLGMGMFIPMKPFDDNRLQFQGYGRNLGEVMQWLDEDSFRYSGITYRR